MALVALAVIWIALRSHAAVCHCEQAQPCSTPAPSACLCVHHAALAPMPQADFCVLSETAVCFPDYAPPHGTAVSVDIFRPPLG